MKRLILSLLMISSMLFAEEINFSFSEISSENIMLTVNNSQQGMNKKFTVDEKGITFIVENKFEDNASTASIKFIEPLKIENISNFKTIKLDYTSFRYISGISLIFEDYKGNKIIKPIGSTELLDGEHTLEWNNPNYIENVKDRNIVLKPLYPYNQADLFLTEIRFHINNGQYNVQRIKSLQIVYDKDNNSGEEYINDLETQFGLNSKEEEIRNNKSNKLREEKKMLEDMEKSLMAN